MWFSNAERSGRRSQPAPQAAARPSGPRAGRPRWGVAPIEALEGRALLAITPLDPGFGTGGVVLGAIFNGSNSATVGVSTTAVAVQADGRIITASTSGTTSSAPQPPLVIHRYNADGSVDTTFGDNGQTAITFGGTGYLQAAPRNLFLTSSGQILVAAEAVVQVGTSTTATTIDAVARLTSTGALDTTFGTGGLATLPSGIRGADSVAVEASGRVVAGGITITNPNTNQAKFAGAVVGLTSTGALDSTFGTGGIATIALASSFSALQLRTTASVAALRLTPTGQILLGVEANTPSLGGVTPSSSQSTLSRLTADGISDSTLGGIGTVDPSSIIIANDFAVQTDGRIVLAGQGVGGDLLRLNTDGSIDATFAPPPVFLKSNAVEFDRVTVGSDGTITALSAINGVYRFGTNGAIASSFARGGRAQFSPIASTSDLTEYPQNQALALTAAGNIVVGGALNGNYVFANTFPAIGQPFLVQLRPTLLPQIVNSYDNSNSSGLAAELTPLGAFAYRDSLGENTALAFGPTGAGQSVPAPGDYDGDGKTDPALYLPSLGVLAYRPSSGGADVLTRFGPTGQGAAIPVPGDYDGDGRTDVALFVPGSATFLVDPSSGKAPYALQFGSPGAGNSIPAPGDYDGSGKTELAVFLPNLGILAYRSALTNTDTYVRFGPTGVGSALPVPGDYDGDGRTDVALYLPGSSTFAIRPSGGAAPYAVTFGIAGAGNSIPTPGDYDGDGKTDIAVFLPGSATYAIDPSGGGLPTPSQFGLPGAGNTVPATVVVAPSTAVSAQSVALGDASVASVVNVPLTEEALELAPRRRHPRAGTSA